MQSCLICGKHHFKYIHVGTRELLQMTEHWLVNGKPGHIKWKDFGNEILEKRYAEMLIERKIVDTLWYVGTIKG